MNKKQQTVTTYNKTAKQMQEKFENVGVRVEDVERGLSLIKKKDYPFVLEIGCAYGREAKEILKHTNRYLGIDIAEEFIKLARTEVPNGTFEVADIETFAFPKGLDLIFAFASLLHSDKEALRSIFDRAHEALNPGGIFYVSLKKGAYKEFVKEDEFGTRTFYLYEVKDIVELAGEGWEVVYEGGEELRGQEWFEVAIRRT